MRYWLVTAVLAAGTACDGARPARANDAPASDGEQAADRASYDRYRQPDRLVAALGLRSGDVVADVGAGTGYLEPRLAAAVGPEGRIVATDIDAVALAELRRRAPSPRIEARVVSPDDPGLEAGAYDLILLAQVDHLLADRAAYLRRLRPALAEGGRVAISNRLTYRAQALAAAGDTGYTLVSEHDLPGQFLFILHPPTHEATP